MYVMRVDPAVLWVWLIALVQTEKGRVAVLWFTWKPVTNCPSMYMGTTPSVLKGPVHAWAGIIIGTLTTKLWHAKG